MDPNVVWAVMLENVSAPTHSLDDDYPEGVVEVFGGWFSVAIMIWRE